jgi:type I restriction enzyme M protein
MNDDRFWVWKLAQSSKADFAFVQHVFTNWTIMELWHRFTRVLFRGAEGHIRQYLIKEKNYLDAVIGMPANIFYGTEYPCILVLKNELMLNIFCLLTQTTFRR